MVNPLIIYYTWKNGGTNTGLRPSVVNAPQECGIG